jgi:hypothetical protein
VSAAAGVDEDEATQTATASCVAEPGRDVWLVLGWGSDDEPVAAADASQQKLEATASFWNEWAGKLSYNGMYRARSSAARSR